MIIQNPLAAAMVEYVDVLRPIAEAAAGYRAILLRLGFPELTADAMAVQIHAHMLAIITKVDGLVVTRFRRWLRDRRDLRRMGYLR